jgi:hypothetical protein
MIECDNLIAFITRLSNEARLPQDPRRRDPGAGLVDGRDVIEPHGTSGVVENRGGDQLSAVRPGA